MGCCGCCEDPPMRGYQRNRWCTDVLFLLVFIAFWAGMVIIASIAWQKGELLQLIRGVDYRGNTCGGKHQSNEPTAAELALTGDNSTWSDRKLIWYPLTSPNMDIEQVIRMGVCVKSCPQPYSGSDFYLNAISPVMVKTYGPNATSKSYGVYYTSEAVVGRCLPIKDAKTVVSSLSSSTSKLYDAVEVTRWLWRMASEVFNALPVFGICIAITFVVSFLVIFLLQFLIGPIVWGVIVGLFALLVIMGALFFRYSSLVTDRLHGGDKDAYEKLFKAIGIIVWVTAGVYFLLMIFFLKRIRISVAVLRLAAKVMSSARTLIFLPLVFLILGVCVMVWCAVVYGCLQTSGDITTEDVEASIGKLGIVEFNPGYIYTAVNCTTNNGTVLSCSMGNSSQSLIGCSGLPVNTSVNCTISTTGTGTWFTTITADLSTSLLTLSKDKVTINYRLPKQKLNDWLSLYNFFGFLWSLGFLRAMEFMIVCFVAVFYYYSDPWPGEHKHSSVFDVPRAIWWTLRYHLGTIALGSLIIAIIQFIRYLVARFQRAMRKSGNKVGQILGCCLQCCLKCCERIINVINKNAYIVCAITSKNFCRSAIKAVELILSNVADIAVVNFIGDWVMIFCKFCICFLSVLVAYLLFVYTSLGDDVKALIIPLVFIGFVSYIVASLFMHIFGTVFDAVLMCYCYDKDENDGSPAKPYYFSEELAQILHKFNQQVASGKVAPDDAAAGDAKK